MPKAVAAVIFDRDGVLNVDHGYVGSADRFEWTPGARGAVARLNAAGIKVIVASNQSGVGRGYYDLAAVHALHAHMQAELAAEGAHIDAFYICPFHAEATIGAFRHPDHPDRKPNPGMLLKALTDFALDPEAVLMIGDQPSDLEAARRAGVTGCLFGGGDLDAFMRSLKLR